VYNVHNKYIGLINNVGEQKFPETQVPENESLQHSPRPPSWISGAYF